jgi:hypothetical protein
VDSVSPNPKKLKKNPTSVLSWQVRVPSRIPIRVKKLNMNYGKGPIFNKFNRSQRRVKDTPRRTSCVVLNLRSSARKIIALSVDQLLSAELRYYITHNSVASQWPRGLRHELPSPAQTLGSWVRILLKARMSVRLFSVCVILCVGSDLATG